LELFSARTPYSSAQRPLFFLSALRYETHIFVVFTFFGESVGRCGVIAHHPVYVFFVEILAGKSVECLHCLPMIIGEAAVGVTVGASLKILMVSSILSRSTIILWATN
jgi:hypothetical protein